MFFFFLGFYPFVRLKYLKDLCPETYTYDQIRAVLTYLQIRYHLRDLKIPYEDFEDFSFEDVMVSTENITLKSSMVIENTDYTDKELLQACEGLDDPESVKNEDLDVIQNSSIPELSSDGEPPTKREKIEEFDYLGMLDSPPRQFAN